jgi:hypothetical protein
LVSDIGSECVVYHVSPARLAVMPAIFGGFCVLLLVAGYWQGELAVSLVVSAILIVVGALSFLLVWYTRLRVCPDGIELRQAGKTYRLGWGRMERVILRSGIEGLVLHEPMKGWAANSLRIGLSPLVIPVGSGLGWGRMFVDPEQRRLVAEGRYVPLFMFGAYFRRGLVQRDIERFAPGLLEADHATAP